MTKILKWKKTKKGLQMVGMGFLSFTVLLGAAVIFMAVLNMVFTKLSWYSVTIIILAIFATIFSVALVIVFYSNAKKAQILVDNLEKVAAGDLSAEIEYGKRDTFAKVYENFNLMTKELNSVRSMRENFVHNISHEIKTPLFSIHGFANILMEGGLTEEEQKKLLGIISDESDRLFRLAESILTLSKLENQHVTGEAKPIKLDVEINDCIILLERKWEKKKIEISADLAPVILRGDDVMLRQVWINLLSNAIKFCGEGGKIGVTLCRKENNAIVTVTDNGCGISPADMPRIFDKYYRAESVKTTEGNGLGLAICKRICVLAGGDITVESQLGKGAAFTVTLPITE